MTKIEDCNRVRSVIKLQGIQQSLRGATLRSVIMNESVDYYIVSAS